MKFDAKDDVSRSIEQLVFEAFQVGFFAGWKERAIWPNDACIEAKIGLATKAAEQCFEMKDPREED